MALARHNAGDAIDTSGKSATVNVAANTQQQQLSEQTLSCIPGIGSSDTNLILVALLLRERIAPLYSR